MTAGLCRAAFVCVLGMLAAGCGRKDRPDQSEDRLAPDVLGDKSRPNVLLISIGSLRPDHLHCYGYPKETSPHLDQFARQGALFENVVSSTSWTLPAHCSMFTGLADSVHGCTDSDQRLHQEHYTLAERLKDAGFATVGFFSNPYLHPVFGLDQGFDEYVDCVSYPTPGEQPPETGPRAGTTDSLDAGDHEITNPRVVAAAGDWLRRNTSRPFFMFVHLSDVHFDYVPPPPYDTMFDPDYAGKVTGRRFLGNPRVNRDMPQRDLEHLLALYDGEIAWTDEHFGEILDQLKELKLLDSTVIILTSDHGTAFFEHDLKGHRNSLFDEVIRIPLIIRYPARIPAGQRHQQQVRTIDLVPTVVDLLGVPWNYRHFMGHSLVPLFAGEALPRDDPAISELYSRGYKLQAFRRLRYKTIWEITAERGKVFDLGADPGELAALQDRASPVAKAAIDDARWSRGFLKLFRDRYAQSAQTTGELPAELRQKLASMGYGE